MKIQLSFVRLVLIASLAIYIKHYNEVEAENNGGVIMNLLNKRYQCKAIGTIRPPRPHSTTKKRRITTKKRSPTSTTTTTTTVPQTTPTTATISAPEYSLTQWCDKSNLPYPDGNYIQSKLQFLNLKICSKIIILYLKRPKLSE